MKSAVKSGTCGANNSLKKNLRVYVGNYLKVYTLS